MPAAERTLDGRCVVPIHVPSDRIALDEFMTMKAASADPRISA
jgi:hypothetical protein